MGTLSRVALPAPGLPPVPGAPESLFSGSSSVQVLGFSCVAGVQWFSASNGQSPVYLFPTRNGGWVKLLGFDWGNAVTMANDDAYKQNLLDGMQLLDKSAVVASERPIRGARVHVAFDSTLMTMRADQLQALRGLVAGGTTTLTVIVTNFANDFDLSNNLTALLDLKGEIRLACETMDLPEKTRVDKSAEPVAPNAPSSSGWRALSSTRSFRCSPARVLFGLSRDMTMGVVSEITTAGGGTVRLIGYNFASGGRGDDRKPITTLAMFPGAVLAPV
ncbi:hypothetical protein GPECTOR_51g713 [Gonium pectorale]|uniref:Uncharacterized protein n=1 Tax=Gonium pectorale TaxID=33097 RepID=A0A150G7A6_GONPE|nr:hypothetical protein GPECTOR_51g713 [Gonium pectorale]|eukprot:KXZ45727.1 hypothetical protein GPECTOR_51g713 [Gonium pectorale]